MKRSTRWTTIAIGIMAIAVGARFGYEQLRHARYFADCPTAGRIDQIAVEQLGTGEGTLVEGWFIDRLGGGALQLDGMRESFELGPPVKRRDVQVAYPKCAAAIRSGFSVRLPSGAHGKSIQLVARSRQGTEVIEKRDYAAPQIRVELDAMDEITPDGHNIVSGWAMSSDGAPIKLEFFAQGVLVASATADLPRADAGQAFPKVAYAAKSGFDARIPFADVPRGEYRMTVRATIPQRAIAPIQLDGPMVRNRHAFGLALTLRERARNPRLLDVTVWLAHESGIRTALLATENGRSLGRMTMQQRGVSLENASRLIRDSFPAIPAGSIWHGTHANNLAPGVHRLQVLVTTNDGVKTTIPAQLIVNGPAIDKGQTAGACDRPPLLIFYPTGPGTIAGLGAQPEVVSMHKLVDGPCVRVGMRIRVEYLRTTLGREKDYVFDPYFKSGAVTVNGRKMTTAGLDEALTIASRNGMPVLVSLDGGVWADSAFSAPEWDVVDHLEEDESAVQWNQFNRSERDDALTKMSGATTDPQIARMMAINVYNARFRGYKKRNLQAAVAHIIAHRKAFSKHDVWINLDSDNYINPWFKDTQWYDYNPDTVRQFREWLTGTGVYDQGAPLATEGLTPKLDLPAINQLAKAGWNAVGEIDPPRGPLDAADPWYLLWVRFKRHIVARHYSDLSDWACEAGFPGEHIYTAIGISDGTVPREFSDAVHGWNDQSGVSLRGGKPRCGHLGVVMYGPVTRDESPAPHGLSVMNSIATIDPSFGVVEFHPANLDAPNRLPSRVQSRKSLETMLNAGAVFISPMWGSFVWEQTLFPAEFHAYQAMEGTEYETEFVRAMLEWNMKHMRPGKARR